MHMMTDQHDQGTEKMRNGEIYSCVQLERAAGSTGKL